MLEVGLITVKYLCFNGFKWEYYIYSSLLKQRHLTVSLITHRHRHTNTSHAVDTLLVGHFGLNFGLNLATSAQLEVGDLTS